jgi:photosystem II stability/assembly factor-like uncharacterized protein
MKKYILISLFSLLILINISYSQSGWVIQNSGTATNLLGVWFYNTNTGMVCGQNGLIMKTTNGGTNWSTLTTSITAQLNGIAMLDSVTALLGAADFNIYRTSNGGANWTAVANTGTVVNRMDFINSSTGFVAATGKVYKTTDKGLTWTFSDLPIIFGTRDISFLDANTGWVSAAYSLGSPTFLYNNYVMKTTNSGASWTSVYSLTNQFQPEFYAIDFNSASIGFMSGIGAVRKTTDGGTAWTSYPVGVPLPLLGMYFLNDMEGYAAGATGLISKTTNGGVNWTVQPTTSTENLFDIMFTNNLTGWAVGTNGTILSTHTGGITSINATSNEMPNKYNLYQNYPNPFNPVTKIKYDIQQAVILSGAKNPFVTLKVYDVLGNEISTIVNERQNPGAYEVKFDGTNYPSGMYFCKLETAGYYNTIKIILLK